MLGWTLSNTGPHYCLNGKPPAPVACSLESVSFSWEVAQGWWLIASAGSQAWQHDVIFQKPLVEIPKPSETCYVYTETHNPVFSWFVCFFSMRNLYSQHLPLGYLYYIQQAWLQTFSRVQKDKWFFLHTNLLCQGGGDWGIKAINGYQNLHWAMCLHSPSFCSFSYLWEFSLPQSDRGRSWGYMTI